jgi:hypothetical protein
VAAAVRPAKTPGARTTQTTVPTAATRRRVRVPRRSRARDGRVRRGPAGSQSARSRDRKPLPCGPSSVWGDLPPSTSTALPTTRWPVADDTVPTKRDRSHQPPDDPGACVTSQRPQLARPWPGSGAPIPEVAGVDSSSIPRGMASRQLTIVSPNTRARTSRARRCTAVAVRMGLLRRLRIPRPQPLSRARCIYTQPPSRR